MLEQGDIVLIPIPFTDLSSQKRRPVVVVSNNTYNRRTTDIVVVAMTSSPEAGDYTFTITSSDLALGQLNHPSQVRVDKSIRYLNPSWQKLSGESVRRRSTVSGVCCKT